MRNTVLLLASMVLAVLLAGGVALTAGMGSAQAAFPGQNGKIAFEATALVGAAAHERAIYTIDPTDPVDQEPALLAAKASELAFSPDGAKIAFVRDSEVWVMDADGSKQVQLTNSRGWNSSPAWFPGGRKIAVRSNRGGRYGDIYILTLNVARTRVVGVKRLTDNRAYE